jgi:hypothetical protein
MIRSSNSVKDFVDEHTTTLSPLWKGLYLFDCWCHQWLFRWAIIWFITCSDDCFPIARSDVLVPDPVGFAVQCLEVVHNVAHESCVQSCVDKVSSADIGEWTAQLPRIPELFFISLLLKCRNTETASSRMTKWKLDVVTCAENRDKPRSSSSGHPVVLIVFES